MVFLCPIFYVLLILENVGLLIEIEVLDYMKDVTVEKIVLLNGDRTVYDKDGFNEPNATMKMAEYVGLLK